FIVTIVSLHAGQPDDGRTLAGLEHLQAALCRPLGAVSTHPSALSDGIYYDDLVAKRLHCGHLENLGYIAYCCLQCGQGKPLVAMRCQASWCLALYQHSCHEVQSSCNVLSIKELR